ncbi:pentatricopeptide repeat-containing protein At5g61800-like isoform X2 [Magnolia sinica]|uniref:pentatricopeptide repeat-containing protein At5g61800-like isoform X2 n=1 Tax=Magnolia sinica TaxID=86752 RepID=UPI002657BA0B|nr:pentatricopeptide repeat-containing protein At5g61800-like isoform X2 [Magnolia sinica]
MPVRDSVSWGTLLVGYTQVGRCNEGIQLFDEMLDLGVRPDNVALVGAISASAQLGMLDKGMAIHDHIRRTGILPNVFLSTGLVDLYAKCGCIGIAMDIFESSHDKNIFTWNAMIASLAMHGHGQRSLKLFMKMQDMENIYNVHRGLSHYGCMADLLGRAGLIEEAVEMIESMPMEGDVYVWGGLLGGCGIHGNVEVAEIAAGHLMELTLDVGGTYSIMVNIYSKARMWKDVARMRRLMYVRRVRKSLGCSWIQVDGVDHEFVAGERWHPQIDEIC